MVKKRLLPTLGFHGQLQVGTMAVCQGSDRGTAAWTSSEVIYGGNGEAV